MTSSYHDSGRRRCLLERCIILAGHLVRSGDELDLQRAEKGRQYSIEFTTGFLHVVPILGSRRVGNRFVGLTVTAYTTEPSVTYASPVIRVNEKWAVNGQETMGTVKAIYAHLS